VRALSTPARPAHIVRVHVGAKLCMTVRPPPPPCRACCCRPRVIRVILFVLALRPQVPARVRVGRTGQQHLLAGRADGARRGDGRAAPTAADPRGDSGACVLTLVAFGSCDSALNFAAAVSRCDGLENVSRVVNCVAPRYVGSTCGVLCTCARARWKPPSSLERGHRH
jgi:hypothetical protein